MWKCRVEMSRGNVTWKCHVEMSHGNATWKCHTSMKSRRGGSPVTFQPPAGIPSLCVTGTPSTTWPRDVPGLVALPGSELSPLWDQLEFALWGSHAVLWWLWGVVTPPLTPDPVSSCPQLPMSPCPHPPACWRVTMPPSPVT